MTQSIFDSVAANGGLHIKPLRDGGTGSPLFCFPGSGGDVDVFREIAAALPVGQSVYAVDMEWLCDVEQEFTVEQLAAFYLDGIRKIQRSGHYYFCGYSFGGLVAYEMAMRLIDAEGGAGLVALLDTPNPALISNLSQADSAQFRKAYLMDRLKKYVIQLVQGDFKTFTRRGLAFIISRLGRFFMPAVKTGFRMVNIPVPAKFRASDPGFLKAWQSYVPKRYARSLVCFRVQDRGPEHDRDPSMGWDACVMGGVQVHIVPGDHVDMMIMPSAGVIAEKLATYLDNSSKDEEPVGTFESGSKSRE
jgi:thioesterase domain-containing protein